MSLAIQKIRVFDVANNKEYTLIADKHVKPESTRADVMAVLKRDFKVRDPVWIVDPQGRIWNDKRSLKEITGLGQSAPADATTRKAQEPQLQMYPEGAVQIRHVGPTNIPIRSRSLPAYWVPGQSSLKGAFTKDRMLRAGNDRDVKDAPFQNKGQHKSVTGFYFSSSDVRGNQKRYDLSSKSDGTMSEFIEASRRGNEGMAVLTVKHDKSRETAETVKKGSVYLGYAILAYVGFLLVQNPCAVSLVAPFCV